MKEKDQAKPPNIHALPGIGHLTEDAITGITDLIEQLHHTILNFTLGSQKQRRTRGITGMVYRNIRSISSLVGNSLDDPLYALSHLIQPDKAPGHDSIVAGINGVLGDHLVARNNPLAIPMQFRINGKPLAPQDLPGLLGASDRKLVVLVHGLCMNDLQWSRKDHNHGDLLARDLGATIIYLYYNTGLHISENGRNLAKLLQNFLEPLTTPASLTLIGHSMGGLVSRSACHYARISGHQWPSSLRKMICLGSPHHGAPLEKGGNFIDAILEISPYSAPFSRLGKVRSSGITDLRYGNVIDEDWQNQDRFAFKEDQRTMVPLPKEVDCYAIAATKGAGTGIGRQLVGDGLVPVDSALGRHRKLGLDFPVEHQWICENSNHLDLLSSRQVYDMFLKWLR